MKMPTLYRRRTLLATILIIALTCSFFFLGRKDSLDFGIVDTCHGPQCKKIVLMPARMVGQVLDSYFEGCKFSHCEFKFSDRLVDVYKAHLAAVEFDSSFVKKIEFNKLRSDQALIAFAHEPQGYEHFKWKKQFNKFNGTTTFSRNSTIYFPWGVSKPLPVEKVNTTFVDYAREKPKGAFAYVSNCNSINYDRLKTMKELSKYVNVDVYGKCTKAGPCSRGDQTCESKVHKDYRFFLAFENSLCKDYISEKFWKTLASSGHYVPVAIGGLSIADYDDIAPPNSFIHAYNFTSIEQLGKYLRQLMDDDSAYNRYHEWKQRYFIDSDRHRVACDMCRIAHNSSTIRDIQHHMFADEWNDDSNCKQYNIE